MSMECVFELFVFPAIPDVLASIFVFYGLEFASRLLGGCRLLGLFFSMFVVSFVTSSLPFPSPS